MTDALGVASLFFFGYRSLCVLCLQACVHLYVNLRNFRGTVYCFESLCGLCQEGLLSQ